MENLRSHPLNLMNKNALVATGCREIPGSVIWFSGYKLTTRALTRHFVDEPADLDAEVSVPPWIFLCGGAVAGLSYWTACYPVDLIKSLIQTEEVDVVHSERQSMSFWRQLHRRYRVYGFRSLYNGFSVTVPRAVIANATIFLSYEYCRICLDSL